MKRDMETQKRLTAILEGAFKGPATALKDIPKRDGGHRNIRNAHASPPASPATVETASLQKKNPAD